MKQIKFFVAALAAAGLFSCEKAEMGATEDGIMPQIRFSTFAMSQTDIMTRAGLGEAKCSKLDFAVFDDEGNLYYSEQQDSSAAGFGTVTLNEVRFGSYDVIAIAHSGSIHAVFRSDSLVDFNGKVPETFCKHISLNVDRNTKSAQKMELSRIVGQFVLVTSDLQPTDIKSFRFDITGGGTCFNPKTGLAPQSDPNVRTVSFSDVSSLGGSTGRYSFYTFLPATSADIAVTANAYDNEGNTSFSYSFAGVPMKVNYQTVYTGKFFSLNIVPSFTVNTKWGGVTNKTF